MCDKATDCRACCKTDCDLSRDPFCFADCIVTCPKPSPPPGPNCDPNNPTNVYQCDFDNCIYNATNALVPFLGKTDRANDINSIAQFSCGTQPVGSLGSQLGFGGGGFFGQVLVQTAKQFGSQENSQLVLQHALQSVAKSHISIFLELKCFLGFIVTLNFTKKQ